jgi:hypothetical protein
MAAIEVYAPDGSTAPPPLALAPLPATLAGRRLVVLDNGKPGAALVMSRIAERLAQRAGMEWLGVRRKGTAATPCEPDLLAALARESDVVLTGSAD